MKGLDVGGGSVDRFGRLQLHTLVHFFTDRHVQVVVLGLLVGPAVAWLVLAWQRFRCACTVDRLLYLAPLLAMTLLVVYHRPYDAVILIPAVAGVVAALIGGTGRRPAVWVMAVGLAAFVGVPWAAILQVAIRKAWIPESIGGHPLFEFFVLAHPTWMLLLITAAGLWIMAKPTPRKEATDPYVAAPTNTCSL